ncbi:hypothetical protein CCP4SC76_760002 [Gammaproteobacteria bacterium]
MGVSERQTPFNATGIPQPKVPAQFTHKWHVPLKRLQINHKPTFPNPFLTSFEPPPREKHTIPRIRKVNP